MHHIIADGWSIGIFFRELNELYRAYHLKEPISLPKLPIQYADFATWQRNWLKENVLEKQKTYWQEALKEIPDALQLPFDHPRPLEPSYQGRVYYQEINQQLLAKIKKKAEEKDVSLFMIMLAAFQALLYRYTNQENIVVGCPVANRHYPQVEGLIGFFVNTLALRTCFNNHLTFDALLDRVKKTTLDAYDHQDVPFEQIVDFLNIERRLDRHPVYQVRFFLDGSDSYGLDFDGIEINPISLESHYSKFDLMVSAQEKNEKLNLRFEYPTDLFEEASIVKLAEHFLHLLKLVIADSYQPIKTLSLININEKQKVLFDWNQTYRTRTSEKSIHSFFENWAEKTPDAHAVVFKNKCLTYAELNQKANQVAHYLHGLGVTKGSLIAIKQDRSLEMVIALIGILKAGCAYVPIDPDLPESRICFILDDTQTKIILTEKDFKLIQAESSRSNEIQVEPFDLAYVIYTSGSTGKPKGVMIEHAQLMNYIMAINERISLDEYHHFAIASTLTTDLSNTLLFGSLSLGKTLHIIPEEYLYSNQLMVQFLIENSIDCLKLVPSHLKALIDKSFPFPKLCLILGGERLDWSLVEKFKSISPNSTLINHYGPTETTIGACTYCVNHNKLGASVPIGRPLSNVEFYILDEYKQPTPIGVFGELYIGGSGLARGYLNRADLTLDKFILHPFNHDPKMRIYRTGDLARYLPDGNVEFLGRIDHQIKIRGHRVELGEIVSALKSHGDVKEAVVIAKDNQLIAYIIADEFTPTSSELRAYLETILPNYMIPVAYIILEILPLTSNGKLDYSALPISKEDPRLIEESYNLPSSPLEKTLVAIWSELLGKIKVGVHDNFFHIGGDSIICIQFVSRARQKGIVLEVKQVFQAPTIAALAKVARLKSLKETKVLSEAFEEINEDLRNYITSQQGTVEEIYPLAPMQEGMLFRTLYEPDSDAYVVQILFEIQGNLEPEKMRKAWQKVVDQTSILRTGFFWENLPKPMQCVLSSAEIPWRTYDFRDQENLLEQLLDSDRKEGFNLSVAPLMRLQLIQINEKCHYLLWTKHHIILDGWSSSLILKRALEEYEQQSFGWPSLPYKKYISWLEKQDHTKAEKFWQNYLKDVKEPTYFSSICDASKIQSTSWNYEYLYIYISKKQTLQLKEMAKRHHITLNTITQGVWALLLNCYLQKEDLIFGITVSGRSIDLEGIEEMIGLFINTLPLRVQINPEETFISLLKRLQEDTSRLQEQAFLPLSKIQTCSIKNKELALFDHIFVFENFPLDENRKQSFSEINFNYKKGKERSEYSFTISIAPRPQLEFKFGYDSLCFSKSIIEGIAHRLQTLFTNILLNENQIIKKISYLDKEEENIILYDWNKTKSSQCIETTLHALFENQVERTPHARAIDFEKISLSYTELNNSANQVAHHLRRLGIDKEQLVMICCERSADMLIGLFGILKAGAAYVPLEPNCPQNRLKQIIQDADIKIILTQSFLLNQFDFFQGQIVCLDQHFEEECTNIPSISNSKNLAYVIYTSGSTGVSKGVMIEHKSVVNYLQWCQKTYVCDQGEGAAMLSSFAFDMSITALFLPLITGKSLFIIREHSLPPFFRLSWIKLTPTHLNVFAQQLEDKEQTNQKLIFIIGGEKIEFQDLVFWQKRYPQALFFNEYGPTEATVACSAYLIPPRSGSPPIGYPIENTELYILDYYLRPVPVGVIGELYIGGVGLARGYLNNSEITSEKFIEHSFSQDKKTRLYQTGDLARYLPSGNIEFIGRKDQQIKFKGYRVELEEIEAILKKHGDIVDVIVIVKNQKIIAYFIAGEFIPLDLELRAFLQAFLPEYMIPSIFIQITNFTMTPNGKLDLYALPDPETIEKVSKKEFCAPRNENEVILADIWSNLLNIEKVSIYDNFFHLGGDSIISIQVVSRARQKGLLISVKQLFLTPTIVELAVSIQVDQKEEELFTKFKGEMELTPIQKRFFEQQMPNYHHFNQAIFLKPNEYLDFKALEKSLYAVIHYHEAFHLRFKQEETCWKQKYIINQDPILTLYNKESQEIIEEIQKSLNIEKGPIIRAALFENMEKKEKKLLLVVHHLVIDGLSWRILLEHLEIAYKQITNGKEVSLPQKTSSWHNWVSALKKYGQNLHNKSGFWQEDYESLYIDFDKGPNTNEVAEELIFSLNCKETTLLLQHLPKAYDTQINDVLLTALVLAKGDWQGKYTINVSLEGHGREPIDDQTDISQTIGWFTSIFPVFLSIENPNDLKASLNHVKNALKAIPNRGIDYGVLRYLSYADRLILVKEPEISFNYLGQWDNSLNKRTLFSFSSDLVGPTTAKENPRQFLISINAQIREGAFKVYWKYSYNHYKRETINIFAENYIKRLKQLIYLRSSPNPQTKASCLIPLQEKGDRFPFFCVHPIGGDIFWYGQLAQAIGIDQPFYAFQNLSWEHPSFSADSMQVLRDKYISQLKKIQPAGPYYLGGWSFGAYVAFEMAKKLQLEGEIIKRLIIFDQPIKKYAKVKSICEQNTLIELRDAFIRTTKIQLLQDEKKYKEKSLLAYEYNSQLLKNYQLKGLVNSVTLFNSSKLCEVYQNAGNAIDPSFGWKSFSKEQEIYIIPGNHFTIFQQPYVKLLAAKLRNNLQS